MVEVRDPQRVTVGSNSERSGIALLEPMGGDIVSVIGRILVPTDYSELAAHAARYAQFLASTHKAEVHVLHVIVPSQVAGVSPVAADVGAVALIPDIETLIVAQKPRMQSFIDGFIRNPGIDVIADIQVGIPHDTIAQYARDNRIDLIVVGSHARGVVNRIFFGSTSKAVLESAPCPVLMVPLAAIMGSGARVEDRLRKEGSP